MRFHGLYPVLPGLPWRSQYPPAREKQVSKFKHKIMASPLVLVRMKQYPFVSLSKIIINGCTRHEIACAAYSKSIEILFQEI